MTLGKVFYIRIFKQEAVTAPFTFKFSSLSACAETVYELPLLPNNTASETFLHKPGAMRNVDWIFITGSPAWW
jgi:hypothetical protein